MHASSVRAKYPPRVQQMQRRTSQGRRRCETPGFGVTLYTARTRVTQEYTASQSPLLLVLAARHRVPAQVADPVATRTSSSENSSSPERTRRTGRFVWRLMNPRTTKGEGASPAPCARPPWSPTFPGYPNPINHPIAGLVASTLPCPPVGSRLLGSVARHPRFERGEACSVDRNQPHRRSLLPRYRWRGFVSLALAVGFPRV